MNVEHVTERELLKAACCNLSESFETNPTVNVAYKDAVTGAKEIQLLGLGGIYSQLLTENIPNMRGIMAARTKPIRVIPPFASEKLTSVKKYELPKEKAGPKMIPADQPEELVRLLHEEAKVI